MASSWRLRYSRQTRGGGIKIEQEHPRKLAMGTLTRHFLPSVLKSQEYSRRSGAYERRRWQRPHPVELLARDLATLPVKNFVREMVWEALAEAGIIVPPPPPKKPERRDHLRVVPPEA